MLAELPPTVSDPALLVDGTEQTLRRVTLGFAVLGWLLADIRASFGQLVHLSPFQYVALQAIARVASDTPWTSRSLAIHFHVSNAYVSMETRPLVKQELLSSQPSPEDRRAKFLAVTAKGTQLLTALAPVQQKVNNMLYSQFDQSSLAQQYRVIERMTQDAEQARGYLREVLSSRRFET